MEETQVVPRNVSLYPEDWEIVDQVAQSTRQHSRSGALRFIIAEYQRFKSAHIPTPAHPAAEPAQEAS